MSGGFFDYKQYQLSEIEDSINELVRSNDDESLDEWGYRKGRAFTDETIHEFKKAAEYLKLAQIYAQRIDWLISGDDSEETFHERLKKELKE